MAERAALWTELENHAKGREALQQSILTLESRQDAINKEYDEVQRELSVKRRKLQGRTSVIINRLVEATVRNTNEHLVQGMPFAPPNGLPISPLGVNASLMTSQATQDARPDPIPTANYPRPEQDPSSGSTHPRNHRYPMLSDTHPTVVQIGKQWIELRCGACGANANPAKNELFSGTLAFVHHLRHAHNVLGVPGSEETPTDTMIKTCLYRTLTREQIEGVLAGDKNAYPIALVFWRGALKSGGLGRRESHGFGTMLRRHVNYSQRADSVVEKKNGPGTSNRSAHPDTPTGGDRTPTTCGDNTRRASEATRSKVREASTPSAAILPRADTINNGSHACPSNSSTAATATTAIAKRPVHATWQLRHELIERVEGAPAAKKVRMVAGGGAGGVEHAVKNEPE